MMKGNNSIFAGWQDEFPNAKKDAWGSQGVILVIVVVLCSLPGPAYCQINDPALLLQQTPADGGRISPGVGVHHFDLDAEVALAAVPNPGYQFVYWLGDVSDPITTNTVVYLDAPKIVIAVFERAEYEFLAVAERSQSAPGGGLRASAGDYSRQGYSGGGGRRPSRPSRPSRPRPPEEELEEEPEEDFPVPEEGDEVNDFPVPEIPEPATAVLLILGSLFAFARGRAEKQTSRSQPYSNL